jgi:hypothetical protein
MHLEVECELKMGTCRGGKTCHHSSESWQSWQMSRNPSFNHCKMPGITIPGEGHGLGASMSKSTAPGNRQNNQRNSSDCAEHKECPANGFALLFGKLVRKEKANPAPQSGAGPGKETQFRKAKPCFSH